MRNHICFFVFFLVCVYPEIQRDSRGFEGIQGDSNRKYPTGSRKDSARIRQDSARGQKTLQKCVHVCFLQEISVSLQSMCEFLQNALQAQLCENGSA